MTITATGMKCGSDFGKAAERILLDQKTTSIVSNYITDFAVQGMSTLQNIITE